MWIGSVRYGWLSIVCGRVDGVRGGPIDPTVRLIRARMRKHLEALIDAYPALLDPAAIVESPFNDYKYRLVVSAEVAQILIAAIASEVSYGNFKSACAAHWGHADPYVMALPGVWAHMERIQHLPTRRRSSWPGPGPDEPQDRPAW